MQVRCYSCTQTYNAFYHTAHTCAYDAITPKLRTKTQLKAHIASLLTMIDALQRDRDSYARQVYDLEKQQGQHVDA